MYDFEVSDFLVSEYMESCNPKLEPRDFKLVRDNILAHRLQCSIYNYDQQYTFHLIKNLTDTYIDYKDRAYSVRLALEKPSLQVTQLHDFRIGAYYNIHTLDPYFVKGIYFSFDTSCDLEVNLGATSAIYQELRLQTSDFREPIPTYFKRFLIKESDLVWFVDHGVKICITINLAVDYFLNIVPFLKSHEKLNKQRDLFQNHSFEEVMNA